LIQQNIKKNILSILNDGETVTAALRRLGGSKKSIKDKDTRTPDIKQKFDLLTESSHQLLSSGYYNIYSETKEQIQKESTKDDSRMSNYFDGTNKDDNSYVANSEDPNDTYTQPVDDGLKWEYKIDEKTFGPYTTHEMKAWWRQGYFHGENDVVDMRQYKEESIFEDDTSNFDWVRSDTLASYFES